MQLDLGLANCSDSPASAFLPSALLQTRTAVPTFLYGLRGVISGPYADTANTVLTEPSPQSHFYFLNTALQVLMIDPLA